MEVLYGALSVCGVCLLAYLWLVLRSAWYFSQARCPTMLAPAPWPAISLIIPARNEAKNLARCLQHVLAQDYLGEWEVLLVDDHSSDRTRAIALQFAQAHAHLRVISPGEATGKKAALAAGIAQARGEIIVQTDADTWMGPHWLRHIMMHFSPATVFVSGPVALEPGDPIFQRLQSLESMGLVALGAGSLLANNPNMCNGANLAFRKAAFEAVGGYAGIDQVASGDDELLLQKLVQQQQGSLAFAKCEAAIVYTRPMRSWRAFRHQRLRWVSKARAYPNRKLNLIQLLSYLGFWTFPLLFLTSLLSPVWAWVLLGVFTLKCVIDLVLMYQAARFFHKLPLLVLILILELLYIPYVIWIGLAGNLVRRFEWKGRVQR